MGGSNEAAFFIDPRAFRGNPEPSSHHLCPLLNRLISLCLGMKRANVIRGRIETHAEGLGTPTEEMVRKRAREIAVTNGRRPDQYNEDDWKAARQDLEGAQNAPESEDEDEKQFVLRDLPLDPSTGRSAPTRVPTDEQTLPDQLVAEGVAEATHEQMVEGNRESRRRDKRFEDQLPESGP